MNAPPKLPRVLLCGLSCAALVALAACTEKPQTASRKADTPAWQGAHDGFVAAGWQAGDRSRWEEQLRHRAQNQNEYTRTPAVAR